MASLFIPLPAFLISVKKKIVGHLLAWTSRWLHKKLSFPYTILLHCFSSTSKIQNWSSSMPFSSTFQAVLHLHLIIFIVTSLLFLCLPSLPWFSLQCCMSRKYCFIIGMCNLDRSCLLDNVYRKWIDYVSSRSDWRGNSICGCQRVIV